MIDEISGMRYFLGNATTKAREVLACALSEASRADAPAIDGEHLLLGLLSADEDLMRRFLPANASVESIRKKTQANKTTPRRPGPPELPLSQEGYRIFAFAAEEGAYLSHPRIDTEHVLLGLLREEQSAAAHILRELGLQLSEVRKTLRDEG